LGPANPRFRPPSEFAEETVYRPGGEVIPLGSAKQRGGKVVHVWAIQDDWDPANSEQHIRDGMAAAVWVLAIIS
jgi:predicted NUDIX family NTP pyrophosphohydrolase